jgi:hypothetical protein
VPGLVVVAVLGVAGVVATLGYNAVATGDPLQFPYQAFAPADGIGFGRREILSYSRVYDTELALRANRLVLGSLATRWAFAAPLGPLVAAFGVLVGLARHEADAVGGVCPPQTVRLLLFGVGVSVVLGNVAFWGNLNVLADLGDPTDGLVYSLGPFYHFDLLVPLSVFGAAGFAWVGTRLAAAGDPDGQRVTGGGRAVLAAAVVLGLVAGGVATAGAVEGPVERNAAYTDRYETGYEPFERRADGDWARSPFGDRAAFDRALVFVPTPYGDWLGHPFQSLSNAGDLGGDAVYALDGPPDRDFRVLETTDRTPYRFTYRGTWTPDPDDRVEPTIQRLERRSAPAFAGETTVGVVGTPASVRLSADGDRAAYRVRDAPGSTLTVPWVLEPGRARLADERFVPRTGDGVVGFEAGTELAVSVTFVQTGGATVTYRQVLTVRERDGRVELFWPPVVRVCRLTPDCGRRGTYIEGLEDEYLTGVSVNTTVGPRSAGAV